MEEIIKILNIRYIKLTFTLSLIEDTILPANKASMLRGGIGEMLLRQNCIANRECDNCSFREACIVQNIMYAHYKIQPPFASKGDSIGYVLECEDLNEHFRQGSQLKFSLILFGDTAVYFNQILQAVHLLGQLGLGKNRSKYTIARIRNQADKELLEGGNIYISNYTIANLGDYAINRLKAFHGDYHKIVIGFRTPVAMKYLGEAVTEFQVKPIINNVTRKLYMLNCFEGHEAEEFRWNEELPRMVRANQRNVEVRRYSSTQGEKMDLKGIIGDLVLEDVDERMMLLLLAGEVTHIGKNSRFGFGRYEVY